MAQAIPLILTVASTAFAAYGAVQQGKAQEAMYKSQAQADEYNATIAEQNAAAARQQAGAAEEAQRRKARQFLGKQRASLAQAGIGLSGSAADVYGQSAAEAELDALNIRYEGEMQARGFKSQATLDKYSARVGLLNAKSARRGGYINAASAMLSGASTGYGQYKGGG